MYSLLEQVVTATGNIVLGKERQIRLALACLLARGHLLIEDLPGVGKTTLISLIAGLIRPDSGSITLNGSEITEPGPDRGVVFQNYSLLPWLSVYENVLLAVDQVNPNYSGALPPYGATNYCVNASVQFYTAVLEPIGHNIRITQNTWDPQLNSPHPSSATGEETFIGDYFGNTFGGRLSYSTFVSTYDNGSNPANQQQQVIAILRKPTK